MKPETIQPLRDALDVYGGITVVRLATPDARRLLAEIDSEQNPPATGCADAAPPNQTQPAQKSPGQIAFERFNSCLKYFSLWNSTHVRNQAGWEAAAKAVLENCTLPTSHCAIHDCDYTLTARDSAPIQTKAEARLRGLTCPLCQRKKIKELEIELTFLKAKLAAFDKFMLSVRATMDKF